MTTHFTVYSSTLDSIVYKTQDGKYKAGIKGKVSAYNFPSIIEARQIADNLNAMLKANRMFHQFLVFKH